jgi:class 3 adenylate cyclase
VGETWKLAAILVADIVGYSRLAGADEDRTLARVRGLRSDLIDPAIAAHHGRIVKRTGDGSIIEFRSVVDAVRCAIEIQNGLMSVTQAFRRTDESNSASVSTSATSSRRATATSWATASISPRDLRALRSPAQFVFRRTPIGR